jgi:acyl carrier protein
MADPAVHARLQDVFREVFDDDTIVIQPTTTASDIEAWDSLEHINLIIAVEREFDVKFRTGEIVGLRNVGEFEALLETRLGAGSEPT